MAKAKLKLFKSLFFGGMLLVAVSILTRHKGDISDFDLFFMIALSAMLIAGLFALLLPRFGHKPTREEIEKKMFDDKSS